MDQNPHLLGFFGTLQHVILHVAVTVIAVGVAFSVPRAAEYILYSWWPVVQANSRLLMMTEVGFAAVLVILFNLILHAMEGRRSLRMNRIASLVHVQDGENNWLSRWRYRNLRNQISGTRDVSVMSITGYDTFVSEKRNLHRLIENSYELRVMLMNPYGAGARRRVQSLRKRVAIEDYIRETEATIERLAGLAEAGKKVTLKFYDDPPFWNLIITGEYAWIQYCHDGHELNTQPEFIFALRKDKPAQGLFSPFYVYFLNQWNDVRHGEYNFATRELAYGKGNDETVTESQSCTPGEQRRPQADDTQELAHQSAG